MFWRRKSDGFEWHKYVRTTIKIRRAERARKIEEIKNAAHDGAKAAGRQGVAAGKEGVRAASAGASQGGRWLAGWLIAALGRLGGIAGAWLRRGALAVLDGGRWFGRSMGALMWRRYSLPRPRALGGLSAHGKIALLFGGLGLIALLSAYLQYQEGGIDLSSALAALVGVLLVGIAGSPWLRQIGWRSSQWIVTVPVRQRTGWRRTGRGASARDDGRQRPMPARPATPATGVMAWARGLMVTPGRAAAAAMGVLAIVGASWAVQSGGLSSASTVAAGWMPSLPATALPSVPSFISGATPMPDINGRARAVSGDTLRIGRQVVHLNGIEAPELAQACKDARNRGWRCGRRARSTLRRLVRRRRVTCDAVSQDARGRISARCSAGGRDLAVEVVERGYAFAEGMIFKTYAAAEDRAREASRGIWQGEALRPSEFRAKKWAAASKASPDGCPIKGRVRRRKKTYVLPWESNYRRVRIRKRRGEKWFCSEAEAADAGFKPSSTG